MVEKWKSFTILFFQNYLKEWNEIWSKLPLALLKMCVNPIHFPTWLILGNAVKQMMRLTVTWWVSHVEQELLTPLEHLIMNSPLVFSGVCVAQSLVFCVMFCRSLFVLFSFGKCNVCPSSIYSFWLPLWYLQTFLSERLQAFWDLF